MNLNDMTVPQLREIAADLEIFGRSKMKRADLIAAIEYAEAPSADNIPGGVDDHAAAVARMRANREAEEEERAAARRARNRTNYAPATEVATQADAAEHVHGEQVVLSKYSANDAIATAAFAGTTVGGHVTRERGRWVLRDQTHTIRAKTLSKVAKQWAKALGFHATAIDLETMS